MVDKEFEKQFISECEKADEQLRDVIKRLEKVNDSLTKTRIPFDVEEHKK